MSAQTQTTDSGPVRESARITSLDLIRGVAVLGILLMNAVSFKFGPGPYFNLSAGGSETWLDWTVGVLGEVFVDQKFMGLFSLLFGAGMILFIDRAASRGRRAIRLNLWRNVLRAPDRHPAQQLQPGTATFLWPTRFLRSSSLQCESYQTGR